MSENPIFFDPKGSRQKWTRGILSLLVIGFLIGGVIFAFTVFLSPKLLNPMNGRGRGRPAVLPALTAHEHAVIRFKKHQELDRMRKLLSVKTPAIKRTETAWRGAFYAPWQETGLFSLRAHAADITHLFPAWFHLGPDGTSLGTKDYDIATTPHNKDVMEIVQQNDIKILPMIDNSIEGKFDTVRVAKTLGDSSARRKLIQTMVEYVRTQKFDGLCIDFENLDIPVAALLPEFLRELKAALPGKSVAICIEALNTNYPRAKIAAVADQVILMAYDEHWEEGGAGPIASAEWTEQVLSKAVDEIPKDKLVLGIGGYAYDWKKGRAGAESITYQEAISLASDNHEGEKPEDIIQFDPKSFNPYFDYEDETGRSHQVWMLDAVTAHNQMEVGRQLGVTKAALWALGGEDPSLWAMWRSGKTSSLRRVEYPYGVDYFGDGEFLNVVSEPKIGSRMISVDTDTGLVDDATYTTFASAYEIRRAGHNSKTVALTFDDGPDPVYTPQILEVLKQEQVPGTFFFIGENAEHHPDLVRQTYEAGHEIGSHSYTHPNLGKQSDTRVKLELNTTQRVLQSILGRSTVLFRPPYNADAEPTSREEVMPVIEAARQGYLTVGELIDPLDWDAAHHSVDDIVQGILKGVEKGEGNCVLLHDSGGDRTKTVAALKIAIPILKERGYKFVAASGLIDKTRDDVMPRITAQELMLVGFDKFAFYGAFVLQWILGIGFAGGIILGFARLGIILPMAILNGRKANPPAPVGAVIPVTVLIAAYNEEKVVVQTIESVLTSDYPIAEIMVVDDGSKDQTSERVREAFANNPKVRLISKPNGGKASALNLGIAESTGEVLFCIDADTVLAADAIGLMASHFTDPKVAAVAGNVKVGNPDAVLTKWQSVEYATSQNMDRRAYDSLNCITVVPGAVGMWRRSTVMEVGGFTTDTLAEDMDLTWRIREAGYRVKNDPRAKAYTEAPDTLAPFLKQRYRWSFGTFQCLWKHRASLGKYGWFGWFALPTLWVFQVVFQILAPLVDLQLFVSLVSLLLARNAAMAISVEMDREAALSTIQHAFWGQLFFYTLFVLGEMAAGYWAYRKEGESPKNVLWVPLQRFAYRQIMYFVMLKAIWSAINGVRTGWGKLDRKATARIG